MPANVWLLNLMVFGVLMEADLGRRKISWFRVLRPLIAAATIVPLFVTSVPTSGRDVALQAVGAGAGVLLGLAAHLFVSVGFGPGKGKKGQPAGDGTGGRAFSRAGFGYAAFWAVIFGARLVFIYGCYHWFSGTIGQFLATHQFSATGLTNALIFMAIAMALARSALLGARGRAAARRAAAGTANAAPGHPAGALESEQRGLQEPAPSSVSPDRLGSQEAHPRRAASGADPVAWVMPGVSMAAAAVRHSRAAGLGRFPLRPDPVAPSRVAARPDVTAQASTPAPGPRGKPIPAPGWDNGVNAPTRPRAQAQQDDGQA